VACANLGDPPGGPPDSAPPALVAAAPESGAVVPDWSGPAVLQFDEVIDEMAGGGFGTGGGGAGGLARLVLLSPVAGEVRVAWHRTRIEVRPREGWKPGRVYRLELLPGLVDLRRNRLDTGRVVIFSTGPDLPTASLAGTALQWVEQQPLVRGLVIAAPQPDTVGYLAQTDSGGRFRLDGVPPGTYVVYAVRDQNNNRRRDRREAYDSSVVTVDSSATATLWVFAHDTSGARLRQAEAGDSLSIKLTFSVPLDPARPLEPAQVTVLALPDSTPIAVTSVLTVAAYDSLAARERAAADSIRRAAADSARRAAGDTAAPAAAPPPRAEPPAKPPEQRPPAGAIGRPGQRPAAPRDTAYKLLLAERPVPSERRVVRVDTPLTPGTRYLVRVGGAVNLNGVAGDGQAVFQTAVRDTTRAPAAPADTTPRKP
jgi:hypothetical protein